MAKKKASRLSSDKTETVAQPPRWLLLTYEPVSLFSLRSTYSMSKGGKTLLIPTPYSVKMALIDAAFRMSEVGALPRDVFDSIKGTNIRFQPPLECVVQNTFSRVFQEFDPGDKKKGQTEADYRIGLLAKLQEIKHGGEVSIWENLDTKSLRKQFKGLSSRTIAYREMCFYRGPMTIAIDVCQLSSDDERRLRKLAAHVNYFGKRGSFFQFLNSEVVDQLPPMFSISDKDAITSIPTGVYGVTQFLDDFGPDLCSAKDGFERISTYHDKDIKLGKHRVLVSTLVPYRRTEASRSFTRYVRRQAQASGLALDPPPGEDNT